MTSKTFRGIPINAMFNWKTANLAPTMLGLFFLIAPWFFNGALDTRTALFGMMFLAIAITRAKNSVTVLGGLMVAFLGMSYFFASIAFMDMTLLWTLSIVLFIVFLIFELGFFKFGPSTSNAKAFALIPLALLSFSLILAFIGQNPMLTINWSNLFVAFNYLSILLTSLLLMLGIVGWRIGGGSANKWIMIFAIATVATAFLGLYQGLQSTWLSIFLVT